MASETFVQPAIPRFDGHYDHWSMLMENFLRSKEYWDVVESGVAEPTARMSEAQKAELEALKLKDLKAKNYLFQAIDRTILETILCKDTSKQIWDSMKKKYQGTTKTKRQQLQALRSEFEILRMKEGETVTDYFSRTMAIVNKLRTHGDKTQDVTVVEKILCSMTPKYNFVVCAIEEANDLDEMSLEELESSLLVHERKLNRQEQNEQALKATVGTSSSFSNRSNRGRGRGRGRNQQTQFFEGRGRGRGRFQISYRPKSADKSKVECFQCHKYGHYQSECRANLPTNEDTGCSNHMCGDKAAFSTLDESFRDNVKFEDNSKVSVRGRGQVTIQIRGNAAQTISNVLYVPELKTNLLSIGQLQEKGYEIIIKNGVCRIQDSKLGLIAQVKMTANRMFPLHLNCASQSCFSAKTNDVAWLWHSRYGHLNFGGLKQLQQKNMVTGLPVFECPSIVCEECVISKQHRDPFPKGSSTRARRLLEIVHSDICGPINPVSNGGKRYFITFIDDFSRKTWVYFLQQKSEALMAFKSFKVFVEKEAGSQIQVLRTDCGGEYNSHEFANFCETHGIKRQLTTAYTPQQNGVCERKNRTILIMVRSLLKKSSIPKNFWPKTVNWSIHILNRSPTLTVQNMTPEEAWSGRKPGVDHFKIFGCITYAHIPDEKRKKLDDKGEKSIFLSVSNNSKAYKLYNPNTKKIIVSRDVIFDEGKFWEWDEGKAEQKIQVVFYGEIEEEKQQQPRENEQQTPGSQSIILVAPATPPTLIPEAESDDGQRPQRYLWDLVSKELCEEQGLLPPPTPYHGLSSPLGYYFLDIFHCDLSLLLPLVL
ncbi:hypothetical protein SLEP1_g47020 [Rubroshorea leprosula]|uniref:Retrovirus-related Pol polyprotein from transposon TNT 1-94 n=1 Tax=Rubroshorea leprosula TaxID=152421 RepID=A0AAV5LP49_9ROSI|nr:hypothetical protein SLEP1_g47020 [Rubroshorea leprosula]